MRIVHVIQYFQPVLGYQETFLAQQQQRAGHAVTVVASDRYVPYPNYDSLYKHLLGERVVGPGRGPDEGIDTWRLPTIELDNHPWCPGLGKALDALDPDVVHLHGTTHLMALSVVRHKLRGARYRLILDDHNTAQGTSQGFGHRLYRRMLRSFYGRRISRAAHAVIGVTRASCEGVDRVLNIDRRKIGMIPLGSDHRSFRFDEKLRRKLRGEIGIDPDARVVLYTGKVRPTKRVDTLVEAMPLVLEKIPDAHLVVVGHQDPECRDALVRRTGELGLGGRIHLFDAVPAKDLPAWFSMADLACWPAEVTISMIDAASCSLPFLAPRADGVEYQLSGGNGEFIEDPDLSPRSLGGQIASLLEDRQRLAEMGKNGRRLVEERLSWDAVGEDFLRLYEGGPPSGYDPGPRFADEVVAVGTYPPPVTGQSAAFALAVDGLGLTHVNITPRIEKADKAFSWRRASEVLGQAMRAWRAMKGKRAVYLTTASSRFGVLRDSLFILPARLRGLKVLTHVHQGNFDGFLRRLDPVMRAYTRWLYRRMTRVIVLSEKFTGPFGFVDSAKLAVVENGVAERPRPVASPPNGAVQILYLSNLMPQKGVIALVEAVARLPEYYTCVLTGRFIVDASDRYRDAEHFKSVVSERIRELGLGDRVRLTGMVDGARKERLLAESHVLCLPTFHQNEGQPLCVIEAMMAGLPVVSTDVGDLASMVEGDRGRRISPVTAEGIAQAVLEVTSDERAWSEMSVRAHEVAVRRYGRDAHLRALEGVLAEAMEER